MPKFQLINVYDAQRRLTNEQVQLVDIRDKLSYQDAHIKGAWHLSNASVAQFLETVELHTPLFVICYHGNSSKGVAQYLCEQGYLYVYSVEGGMAAWPHLDPL